MAILGLTGKRGVGKTEIAGHLVAAYGFARAHPLAGGKAAAVAYFEHLGAPPDIARRMAHGDLRDRPSPYLPDDAMPRLFLERFGRFMGETMGAAWTLGMEIDRHRRSDPARPLVVESIVYEAAVIRAAGGRIVRIVRPGHQGPTGIETDTAQAAIDVDATLMNDGDLAQMRRRIDAIVQPMIAGG